MGLFSKKNKGETIDFTYLQKRGLLPTPRHRYSVNLPTSKDGVVDFRAMADSKKSSISEPSPSIQSEGVSTYEPSTSSSQPQGSSESGAFGFLANMAGVASTETSTTPTSTSDDISNPFAQTGLASQESSSPSDDSIRIARRARMAEFNAMKMKLEDIEYKLERSLERIAQLEGQIAELKK